MALSLVGPGEGNAGDKICSHVNLTRVYTIAIPIRCSAVFKRTGGFGVWISGTELADNILGK